MGTDDYDTEHEMIDEPPWELADQFTRLFGEEDGLRSRTASGVETRLRSGSVASTLAELTGIGFTTLAEILGTGDGPDNHRDGEA